MKTSELSAGCDPRAIQAEKAAAEKALADYNFQRRVEQAAIAIYAGMQANPNWNGSAYEYKQAVTHARCLVAEIDRSFSEVSGE